MPVLVLDPLTAQKLRSTRERSGHDRWDEVWEGVYVVAPAPNTEHFRIASLVNSAISQVIHWEQGDQCMTGSNISDRLEGWTENFRVPDVVVYLNTNTAIDHGTHWQGGPDFLVEIISDGEEPHAKIDFYSRIATREVLIINRYPWSLELFQLQNGKLELAGSACPSDASNTLTSSVLPLSFQLLPAQPRPQIRITHTPSNKTWDA